MSKIEDAVVELCLAQAVVRGLSKQIGDALNASYEAQIKDGGEYVEWLKLAYAMESGPSDSGYGEVRYHANHEDDVAGYLEEHCVHTLRAHQLIQERKVARRRLGIARRRVSVIGRTILRSREKGGAA